MHILDETSGFSANEDCQEQFQGVLILKRKQTI